MAGKGSSLGPVASTSAAAAAQLSAKKSRELSAFAKFYLIAYNVAQVFGWSYMLYQLAWFYLCNSDKSLALWDYIGWTVIIFQNAAILEILHAAIGIVQSNVVLTTFQVFSRVMVVCGVLLATPRALVSPGLPLALLAWSVTEIIRYSFYGFNIINKVPHILVWLRYTTFIILYPIGVTGELLCFYYAIKGDYQPIWSLEMPNRLNSTFSYLYFLYIVMFLYIPLFPQLYLHMFAQRKKVLGGGSVNKIKTK